MTTLDKLVAAARNDALDAAISACRDVGDYEAARMISTMRSVVAPPASAYGIDLDALSSLPAQAVGVKPLEWFTELDHLAVAISPVGVWRVWNNLVLETPAPPTTKRYDSLDGAKAAAQADYEARILSALVAPSQPAAVAVTDEMVDRAARALSVWKIKPGMAGYRLAARDMLEAALRSTP